MLMRLQQLPSIKAPTYVNQNDYEVEIKEQLRNKNAIVSTFSEVCLTFLSRHCL